MKDKKGAIALCVGIILFMIIGIVKPVFILLPAAILLTIYMFAFPCLAALKLCGFFGDAK